MPSEIAEISPDLDKRLNEESRQQVDGSVFMPDNKG
jgi:hypothetical protein